MDKVMANQNDFALLSDLMQGADYSLNLAANSALMKYMEETAEKTNAANKQRNAELHASLWDGLNNGADYKYLRDQGYHFEEGSNGIIVAVIQVNSGEVKLAGHAMDSSKYSPGKTFQTFSIETKFDPPAIKVGQIDPETFRFSSDLVQGFVDASGDLETMYEKAFAGFSDKSKEVEEKFAQNKEVEDFNNNVYSTGKDKAVSEFIKLAPDMKASYISMVASIKSSYEAQGFKFTENNGILHSEKAVESEISMPTPWGKIPMKVNRGYTKLDIRKDFMLGFLNFNFDVNKNGLGDIYGVINDAYDRFSKYSNDALKVEAPKADPWMDVALGMIGQSGSIAQKFTTSAQSYGRNQVTTELARVTGAPLAWVNAITQKGATEKSAFNDYGKSLFFAEVEKNTGIDMSLVQQKIAAKEAKHAMQQTASYQIGNALGAMTQATSDLVGGIGIALGVTNRNEYQKTDFAKDSNQEHFARQVYENREVIDTVIDVAAYAVAAAGVAITIVSAGTLAGIGIPMVAYSMASLASYKAVQGAIEGGVVGAITGAANVGNAFTIWYGGAYDVSYSYADGFATSVGFGGKGLGASVHYDDGGGGFGASAGAAFGSVLNAGVNYDDVTGMGANVGIGLGNEGRSGNLGFNYNRNDGFGASLTGNVGQATGGLTYNLRAGVGVTAQYNFAGQTNAHNSTNFGLNYNRADGYTASMDMRGANALSYNQYTGMHANQNYMADAMMNRGLAEEVESDSWLGSIGTALGMNLRTSNQIWNGQIREADQIRAIEEQMNREAQESENRRGEATNRTMADNVSAAGLELLGGRRENENGDRVADENDPRHTDRNNPDERTAGNTEMGPGQSQVAGNETNWRQLLSLGMTLGVSDSLFGESISDATPTTGTHEIPDVKYHSQLENTGIPGELKPSHMCMPTSVAAVMEFLGVSTHTGDDIVNSPTGKKILGKENGVEAIINYADVLAEQGKKATMLQVGKDGTITQSIKDMINKGVPVVISGDMGGIGNVKGHIMVITGYNDKGWIVNDPFGNANTGYKDKNGEGVQYDYGKYKIGKKYGFTIDDKKK